MAENARCESIEEEVCEVRHNALRSLALYCFYNLIIRRRMELYKDFAYYTDTRLLYRLERKFVKILYYSLHKLVVAGNRKRLKLFFRAGVPFFIQCIRRTRHCFVRARTVKYAHKKVADHNSHYKTVQKNRRNLKAWIFFKALCAQRKNRNLSPSCIVQGAPDKADIVCCTASAACLRNDERNFVYVVLS